MKPPIFVKGMFGIGDNIHQRAPIRDLMKMHSLVILESNYVSMYQDLVDQGLKLHLVKRAYSEGLDPGFDKYENYIPDPKLKPVKLTYTPIEIRKSGSILAAQYRSIGLKMPLKPDFSLQVPDEWREIARGWIRDWGVADNPIMLYRPIIDNGIWRRPNRSPDPKIYKELFDSIRSKYFVVSICNHNTGKEKIASLPINADVEMHHGIDFKTLAGLFAEANLVFGCPGFFPVLGQAVGTPSVTTYGGNESSKTTQSVGTHLAPTLSIEPDYPCDCHNPMHRCNKKMFVPARIERLQEFSELQEKKALVFCTTYMDSEDKAKLLDLWITNTRRNNDDCDILIVDSNSPNFNIDSKHGSFADHRNGLRSPLMIKRFPDNIGHLARKGRDGWGRAFTYGLNAAICGGYRYVAHIEGDSMFRLPVIPITKYMDNNGINVQSIAVEGTKRKEQDWVETGLMFFKTSYLRNSDFIRRYDWENGRVKRYPHTPEWYVYQIVKDDLKIADWKGLRNDCNQVNRTNFPDFHLDWITHCNDMKLYEFFLGPNADRLSKDYDATFFNMHEPWKVEYRYIADMLSRRFQFQDAIDLGCGNGFILSRLKEEGKYVVGIDGSVYSERYFPGVKVLDLTVPLPEDIGKFELVICTEVAEHIEEKYAEQLVDNVCNSAVDNIFFSAAKAGHGGHLHVNEQERLYWLQKFQKRGFYIDIYETDSIIEELKKNISKIWWFGENSFVLRKKHATT